MRADRIERAERHRVHLERSGAIDEAVAGVRRELDATAGQHALPDWDDLTSAAVRNLLGLVQRHRTGDLVLLVPDSGYAVRIRHDGAVPTAGVVAVPGPRRPAPEEGAVGTDPAHGLLGAGEAPPGPGAPRDREPVRSLDPGVRQELEERRRAARERLARRAGPLSDEPRPDGPLPDGPLPDGPLRDEPGVAGAGAPPPR